MECCMCLRSLITFKAFNALLLILSRCNMQLLLGMWQKGKWWLEMFSRSLEMFWERNTTSLAAVPTLDHPPYESEFPNVWCEPPKLLFVVCVPCPVCCLHRGEFAPSFGSSGLSYGWISLQCPLPCVQHPQDVLLAPVLQASHGLSHHFWIFCVCCTSPSGPERGGQPPSPSGQAPPHVDHPVLCPRAPPAKGRGRR